MRKSELSLILHYATVHPIRVGNYGGEVIYCLSDLMRALRLPFVNVTNLTRRMPEELYFRASTVDLADGRACNSLATAVTMEGAYLTLSRIRNIDLYDVLELTRWMKTIKSEKIKKGA